MIISYFKTSGRVIVRHKLFSFINIVGLAVSMSVGLLIIVFVSDLISYDGFHVKRERIFRIISKDRNHVDVASSSVLAGRIIKENFPGIEETTLVRRGFGGDASTGESTLPVSGLWADESFLSVFTFPLLYGNASTALKDPYFIERKLYPNVDFYSGIIYRALGIPVEMFTVMFAMGRLPGWIAQWKEMRENKEPIGRPRQIYTGATLRSYVPIDGRA